MDAFERALRLIEDEGLTLEGSLAGFSAAEVERIRPMLAAVLLVKEQASDLPAPVDKEANKARFLAEMAALRAMPVETPGNVGRLKAGYKRLLSSGLMRSIVATTAVLALTGGAATAAGSSGPESPLYPLKRAVEKVEEAMPRSDFAKATLHLSLAETRLTELAAERHGDSETNKKLSLEVLGELAKAKGLTARLSPAQRLERLKKYDALKQRYEDTALLERQKREKVRTRSGIDRGSLPIEPKRDGDAGGKSTGEPKAAPENGSEESAIQGVDNGPSTEQEKIESENPAMKETHSPAVRDRHAKKAHKKHKHKKSHKSRRRTPKKSGWIWDLSPERSR